MLLLLRLGAAAALLAGALAVPASAVTRADLAAARTRLAQLEAQIARQETEADAAQSRQRDAVSALNAAGADLDRIRRDLRAVEGELAAAELELGRVRDRLALRARAVYMQGPSNWIDGILAARSVQDLRARVDYAARVIASDQQIALDYRRRRAVLEAKRAERQTLALRQAERVSELRAERRSVDRLVASQIQRLTELAAARAEGERIVKQFADALAAEELSRFTRVAGKGMPISFGQWAGSFLGAAGAPVTRANQVAIVAWEVSEYTKATWNPLATTYAMPGASTYNSAGVKNYSSMEQGIEATLRTLGLPGHSYEAVLESLRASRPAMDTGRAINASDWCRGCTNGNYVIGIIPSVEQYYERYASS